MKCLRYGHNRTRHNQYNFIRRGVLVSSDTDTVRTRSVMLYFPIRLNKKDTKTKCVFKKNIFKVISQITCLFYFGNSVCHIFFIAEREALHATEKAEKKLQMREKVLSFFSLPIAKLNFSKFNLHVQA